MAEQSRRMMVPNAFARSEERSGDCRMFRCEAKSWAERTTKSRHRSAGISAYDHLTTDMRKAAIGEIIDAVSRRVTRIFLQHHLQRP